MNISCHLLSKPDLHPDESCVKDETLRKSTILWPTVVSWATNTSNFTYEKSPLNIATLEKNWLSRFSSISAAISQCSLIS